MARQKGTTKFTGRLGDITGYQLNGKYVVRSLPAVSKERRQHDPAYEEARNTSNEFGKVSKAGKLFRDTLRPFIAEVAQKQLDNPVNKLLSEIKNADPAPKGERTVGGGLLQPGMAERFRGFEFHHDSKVQRFLHAQPVADTDAGTVRFVHFDPASLLDFPRFATHVQLSVCCARIDFTAGEGVITTGGVTELTPDDDERDLVLTAPIPEGPGLRLWLLKVVFIERNWGEDVFVKGGCVVTHIGC